MQGFEQIGRGADALNGSFEDVFRVRLGVESSVGVSVTLVLGGDSGFVAA